MDATVKTATPPATTQLQRQRRTWLTILTIAVAAIALVTLGWWWLNERHYQSTDDAYVAGDLVGVMSQVTGTVVSIAADETDRVQAGQELMRLDATDYRIALQISIADEAAPGTSTQYHGISETEFRLVALGARCDVVARVRFDRSCVVAEVADRVRRHHRRVAPNRVGIGGVDIREPELGGQREELRGAVRAIRIDIE